MGAVTIQTLTIAANSSAAGQAAAAVPDAVLSTFISAESGFDVRWRAA